jgi:hypothetical protein
MQEDLMSRHIPIHKRDNNAEVLARIVKAASQKYDCDMRIGFTKGNCTAEFIGDETLKPMIAEDVKMIFANEDSR